MLQMCRAHTHILCLPTETSELSRSWREEEELLESRHDDYSNEEEAINIYLVQCELLVV